MPPRDNELPPPMGQYLVESQTSHIQIHVQLGLTLPVGQVTVKAVKGGLDIEDEAIGDVAVIASAAIEVRIER